MTVLLQFPPSMWCLVYNLPFSLSVVAMNLSEFYFAFVLHVYGNWSLTRSLFFTPNFSQNSDCSQEQINCTYKNDLTFRYGITLSCNITVAYVIQKFLDGAQTDPPGHVTSMSWRTLILRRIFLFDNHVVKALQKCFKDNLY